MADSGLALVVATWFVGLLLVGVAFIGIGQRYDSPTMNLLGLLLAFGGLGSLALMTPFGAARLGGRPVVASWFRGMTAAASAVAIAFLAGYASLPSDQSSKALNDLGATTGAAGIAIVSALLMLTLDARTQSNDYAGRRASD
jgi:hypothetical protein